MLRLLRGKERGDTIVEVLVALAVLSLAFSISYATANKSLLTARNSEEHSEALQYLNSQVELARADADDPALYNSSGSVCMDANQSSSSYGKPIAAPSAGCTYKGLYQISYTYNQAKSIGINQDVFTFSVQWEGLADLGVQQESLNYKIHDVASSSSFGSALTGGTGSGSGAGGSSVVSGGSAPSGGGGGGGSVTPPPQVSISAALPTVSAGQNDQIFWSVTGATTCTASGAWGGSRPTSGFYATAGLFFTPTTYTLTCTGAGGTGSGSTAVIVKGGIQCNAFYQAQGRC